MEMSWGQLSAKLTMNSFKNHIPLAGQFELTTRCNLGCKMCYACNGLRHSDLKIRELSLDEWLRLAREARDCGMLFLLLTGGEVFMREDFKELYEEITQLGFIISIYTNGTLITEEVIKWLKTMPPSQLDISLYGASPDTYRKVCGNAEGFKAAIEGIRRVKEAGINLQIRTTVIRENQEDLEGIKAIAESFGLRLSIVNYISPERERREIDTGRLSPAEQAQLIHRVMSGYQEQAESGTEKLLDCIEKYDDMSAFPCNSGKNSFFITWDGSMVPCSIMNTPKSFPLKQTFPRAWKELSAKCEKVPECKTCSRCSLKEHCNACPARILNETGSFTEPAPYLCELARENAKLKKYNNVEEMV